MEIGVVSANCDLEIGEIGDWYPFTR